MRTKPLAAMLAIVLVASCDRGSEQLLSARAVKLQFRVQPTDVLVGSDMAPTVAVDVLDARGNLVQDDGFTTVMLRDMVTGDVIAASFAQQGVARFPYSRLWDVGVHTFRAESNGLASVTSAPFRVSSIRGSRLRFSVQPAGGTVNDTLPTFMVSVVDSLGSVEATAGDEIWIEARRQSPAAAAPELSITVPPPPPQPVYIAGTARVAADRGVARYHDIRALEAGGYTLVARAYGRAAAQSDLFWVTREQVGP
jgi:hypothetical protein